MAREIEQVEGASIEEFRVVGTFPDARTDALESAARLCEADSVDVLHETLLEHVRREFLADWTALLEGDTIRTTGEQLPSADLLHALAAGTAASPLVADGTTGPDDLAVAELPDHGATLMVGRDGRPFRRRERVQLLALTRIADRAWTLLASPVARLR
jgi:hypothetical protein